MDKQITTITSIKSSDDLRTYLEQHTQLNLSLMKDKNQATLLHYSAFKNDIVKMKLYLQHYKAYCQLTHGRGMYMNQAGFQSKLKAWINTPNKQGLTPIHFSALHGNIQMIKLLEQLGANMEYKTKQQENILFMCVQNNQLKTLIFLLSLQSLKIDLNEQNNIGDNILHKSAKNGYILLTSYLLTTSINKNAQNKQGWTPLMQATIAGSKEVVKRLLLKGADRHIKNNDGKTVKDLAEQQGKIQFVNILNDDFTCGQQIKIACNIKIVYRVQKPSYLYTIFFVILYHIVFIPTCIMTEFSILPQNLSYVSAICEAIYYVVVIILYFLLLRKQQKKKPTNLLNISLPFCPECKSQTKNQFHCFTCDRCIYRYDHHCPWINNCIGGFNIGKFYLFLWLLQIGAIFVIFCHVCIMLDLIDTIIEYRTFIEISRNQEIGISILSLLIAIFFGLSIMMLIIQQTKNLTSNTTSFQRAKKKQFLGSSLASSSASSNRLQSTMLSNNEAQLNQSLNQQHKIDQQQEQHISACTNCSTMLCGQ